MALTLGVHAIASTSSGTTATTAAITTQASGSGLEVVINYDSTTQTFTSVTDSKSNTWTQIGSEIKDSGTVVAMRRYRCANATGGASHTFTLTCSGSSACGIAVIEIKTTNGVGVTLDQEGAQQDDSSPFTSTSETTTVADEFMIGAFTCTGDSGTYTHTWGNSFTLSNEETSDIYFALSTCYRIVTATGTYNTTVTVTPTGVKSVNSLDTFSEAAAGGGGIVQRMMMMGMGR